MIFFKKIEVLFGSHVDSDLDYVAALVVIDC